MLAGDTLVTISLAGSCSSTSPKAAEKVFSTSFSPGPLRHRLPAAGAADRQEPQRPPRHGELLSAILRKPPSLSDPWPPTCAQPAALPACLLRVSLLQAVSGPRGALVPKVAATTAPTAEEEQSDVRHLERPAHPTGRWPASSSRCLACSCSRPRAGPRRRWSSPRSSSWRPPSRGAAADVLDDARPWGGARAREGSGPGGPTGRNPDLVRLQPCAPRGAAGALGDVDHHRPAGTDLPAGLPGRRLNVGLYFWLALGASSIAPRSAWRWLVAAIG